MTWTASNPHPFRDGLQTAIQGWTADGRIHYNSRSTADASTYLGAHSCDEDGDNECAWYAPTGQHVGLGNVTADGQYAVATVARPGVGLDTQAEPGRGVSNDVYLIRADGSRWPLTVSGGGMGANQNGSGLAVIWPMIHPTGSKVCFSRCYWPAILGGFVGYWDIMVGDIDYATHKLVNIRKCTPAANKFCETYGWDARGRLLFASSVDEFSFLSTQIWVMNENKTGRVQVSNPLNCPYCEFSQQLPNGAYVYCTYDGAAPGGMDHWVRPPGPSGAAYKLTSQSYADPDHPMATSFAIKPDGSKMVATYTTANSEDMIAVMFDLTYT